MEFVLSGQPQQPVSAGQADAGWFDFFFFFSAVLNQGYSKIALWKLKHVGHFERVDAIAQTIVMFWGRFEKSQLLCSSSV